MNGKRKVVEWMYVCSSLINYMHKARSGPPREVRDPKAKEEDEALENVIV